MAGTTKSGMLVATAILLVGAGTAGVAWWYNLSRTQRALDYWGPDSVSLIRDAPRVQAYRAVFGEGDAAVAENRPIVHPLTQAQGRILAKRDISRAKGLIHLRHALLDDRSFDWRESASASGEAGIWQTGMSAPLPGLAFELEGARLTLYFSADFNWMAAHLDGSRLAGRSHRTVSTRPIAGGLAKYFAEALP